MRPAPLLAPLALCLAVSAPAMADETQMSAAEFEAYVTGRTLYYASRGSEPYGAEQYLSDRRVIWTFLDGACINGFWYEEDGLICFIYEADFTPQCWSFWSDGEGIAARFESDPVATELFELSNSEQPLRCPGPDVGV